MKKPILYLWVVTFVATFPLFGSTPLLRLEAQLSHQSWYVGRFTQTSYDKFQNKTTIAKGNLSWKRPGLARFEYVEPDPFLLVVGATKVWIVDPLLENVTVESKEKVDRLEALSFLFGRKKLTQLFKLVNKPAFRASSEGPGWLVLVPLKPTPSLAELHLKPGNRLIEGFSLFDDQGNWRRLDLTPSVNRKPPKQSDFIYHIPQGMEVIDKLKLAQ